MRRQLVGILAAVALVIPSAGCIMKTRNPSHSRHEVKNKKSKKSKKSKKCRPSQYWDGRQCRHKGKGKGARKHDGR
jgi:hypothetical protein